MTYENTYEPEEDSFLLLEQTLKQIKENNLDICEVGVGSGYVISNLINKFPNNNFYGSDINPFAIEQTKKKNSEIKLINSSLLEKFEQKFDLIIFNTPYLPLEDNEKYEDISFKDKAIYGGEKGYEVIEEFIYEINDKLKDDGQVIMIYSSLSNHNYIKEILHKNLFNYKLLKEESHFFEKLYCLQITKSELLKEFKELNSIKYFTYGKHSKILSANLNCKNVIIKTGNAQHIEREIHYLKKLKKEDFSPNIYLYKKNYVVMDRINGITIEEYLKIKSKKEILNILDKILNITQRLDYLQIQKFELTNPYKHILIDNKENVIFIDFERSIISLSPKNTTQILQYFRRNINLLKTKDINIDEKKIFEISKKYKSENFKIIIENILE